MSTQVKGQPAIHIKMTHALRFALTCVARANHTKMPWKTKSLDIMSGIMCNA
jgi:hypothetical protein